MHKWDKNLGQENFQIYIKQEMNKDHNEWLSLNTSALWFSKIVSMQDRKCSVLDPRGKHH